jgi:hypothetical protein
MIFLIVEHYPHDVVLGYGSIPYPAWIVRVVKKRLYESTAKPIVF